MQELMDMLENYTRPSLMDDYYTIKKAIEMENDDDNDDEEDQKTDSNNNNNNNSKSIANEIIEYFQSTIGQCKDFSNCRSFVRNRRPRTSDSIKNERRAAFYIRAEDVQRYENAGNLRFEVKEVILQSSLDVIHNYIFHAKDEQMNVDLSHANKFVTEVLVITDENDTKSNTDQKVKKMGAYSFGINTEYWSPSSSYFVKAKYPDIKTELISNTLYPISMIAFETLEEQMEDILQTHYGKSLRSKRAHDWMKINGEQLIPRGTVITKRHLISVLSYTNYGKMQYLFKKFGFRKKNDDESDEDVRERNSEIAHWSRAIYEVIHCWGSVMSKKKPLYHGINCKLLFSRFSRTFFMPTSLTTNVRIAQNFATGDGIILVLKHGRENDTMSLMFDVSPISDFPNEEERLISRTKAVFFDIIIDGQSLKQWMKVLRIYERIRMGRFLSHVSFSEAHQAMIVCMIDNYLQDLKSKKKTNAEFYENGNVPNYIQQLFRECSDAYNKFSVNTYAVKRMISNERLVKYLDVSQNGKNSTFLKDYEHVRESFVYEWKVTGDAYAAYYSDSCPWIIDDQKCSINIANASEQPSYLDFHFELKNDENDNLLWCLLRCDHLPPEVKSVNLNLGIYIEETKSEVNVFEDVYHNKKYASGLHSVVDSSDLLAKIKAGGKQEFNVKLFVMLWNKA